MVISFTCVLNTRLIGKRILVAMFMKWNIGQVNREKRFMIFFVKVILCSVLERKEQNSIILVILKWQGTLNLTTLKNTSVGFLPSSSTGINNIFLTDFC